MDLSQAHPVSVSVPETPIVTVFVRHSQDCKYKGDETWKKCSCRKHLRWTHGGKQYRRSARTRSWAQAEMNKRDVESKFAAAGGKPIGEMRVQAESRKSIEQAVQL